MSTAPAYAIDGRPVPRPAFYAAACDPARSVVVEACAGAGKTWMLVSRILRALLAGAQPHEILAITFTRKAAGEMRARLDEWLREFASPACGDSERVTALRERGLDDAEARALAPTLAGLHERLLRGGRTVEVRTFHAWFSQLLRAAPLELLAELGLQPDMELIEDPADHRPEVYRRFHAAVLADPALRSDYDVLVRERGRTQLRKWLDAAWEKRVEIELADAAGRLDDSVPPARMHWAEFAGFEHPAQRLLSAPAQSMLRTVAAALMAHKGVVCRKRGALLDQALALREPLPGLAAARAALFTQKGELRKNLDAPGLPEAAALLHEIERACVQQAAHEEHRRMVHLSRALLAEFAAYKRSRGLADMADLEGCAFALLGDATLAGWVQERLDARVRHLLIDEFQDTSPLQWHALHAWLSGYAGAGGGASGQRPPGVFIVGDPKQSIYRFRRAEPRVFDAARDFVVQGLGGSVLACDHTRRNAPEVLAAVNEVFDAAQRANEFSGFRPHTTEIAAVAAAGVLTLPRVPRPPKPDKAEHPDEHAEWRDSLSAPRHEPDEVLREQEAQQVALAIEVLIATRQAAPDDIMILCRKRESLRLVAQALAARHVPFAAAEDFSLLDAPEARDLVALLDVLVSPQHRLSLAHALRSPVFGVADDDLVTLAVASAAHCDWWRALRELDHPSAALRRAQELLPRWQAAAGRLPPHDVLDLVVDQGQVRERVAAAVPAERRAAALGAIDAVLHQALTLDGARYATPYNFVRALKRRKIRVPAAMQPGAVQLLTVHGAKGLEADVVFVMDSDPEPKAAETATLLVDWPVESEHPLLCAFVYSEAQCPPSLSGPLERERAARAREELNGLYVAMSRARTRLVFSATEPFRLPDRASWWARVEVCASPWSPVPVDAAVVRSLPTQPSLASLPPWQGRRTELAAAPIASDGEASRLGQAVHRVLEWAAAPSRGAPVDLSELAASAALEFAVDDVEVARLADRIWASPACRRFFGGAGLRWAGNEVPVGEADQVLRIDRLVELEEDGQRCWWVLDYKLQHAPQALAAYREQLLRYRSAIQRLQPGDTVRCAFITGAGEIVEVP
ncbi:UvrD-helicase domain-containing protein [Piscinibacter sp.]|uniref:UvrD-helicase domain-containing protein n=1 Tax=Piscinibacter sp. TaxID=1903157 RepID=UPI002CAE4E37|nr:UvrD-helicase domain-containing protein [Albitalea sp.]HUG22064.1 UvrD-helicase domain-containing protein [Albitalea sp.]